MSLNKDVYVALDLGSDTLKVAYAFKDGTDKTGKIVNDKDSLTALPAVAYFDEDSGKWYYADEVMHQRGNSYLTVVKIKQLLTLLQPNKKLSDKEYKSNVRYYKSKNCFPKFVFPPEGKQEPTMAKLEKEQKTFSVEGCTPQSVCEKYFSYVGALVTYRIRKLMSDIHMQEHLHLSIVYPPNIGKECIEELKRLVKLGFDEKYEIEKVLSMTKSLSIYAKQRKFLSAGQSALVFNVGEDKTFVAKTNIMAGGISIDGVEGHNSPIDLGGNDVDQAVADYLELQMHDRETMGSPSVDEANHIYEEGLLTKQYLFLQEIKTAKIFFGMYGKNEASFSKGVPINVSRDLLIQLRLTHDEFSRCVGISKEGRIMPGTFADKLFKYIESELVKNINRGVKHVFITGGVVETYNLVDALRAKLTKLHPNVSVGTFESESRRYDGTDNGDIFDHEDAVYAPAVGCALASLNKINVDTVTSFTYGTDAYINGACLFSPLIYKNEVIGENGRKAYRNYVLSCYELDRNNPTNPIKKQPITYVSLFIFSISLGEKEITGQLRSDSNLEYYEDSLLLYRNGNTNTPYFRKLESQYDFKFRNSRQDAQVDILHNGAVVKLLAVFNKVDRGSRDIYKEITLKIIAGVELDENGIAKPYVANNLKENANSVVYVGYMSGSAAGTTAWVPAQEIQFKVKDFTVKIDGAD